MTDVYEHKVHTYKGYALVKSVYGGSWHIHEVQNDGEINMFREYGFARTIGEAKKIIDGLKRKERKSGKKRQSEECDEAD